MTNFFMLNSEQRKAVEDTEGAVLVFAGAGSGKTRVLTHRIIHLIEDLNVSPYSILAITFTNKATHEMKQRLDDMLGGCNVWVSTFHSLCVNILFRHAEKIGYKPSFSIFDESASKRLVLKILKEKRIDEKHKDTYLYHISTAKNAGLLPDEYFNKIRARERDAMSISEVYERYEQLLFENNAMDFDGLLLNCEKLLSECPEVREYYQNKFKYIHVDEFQDTNEIQLKIINILAGKWGNIFVVGDDDQSIYGWRGAEIKNILNFEKTFKDAKIYKLEQNYRSTQNILDAANRLIAHNENRKEKKLFSENGEGARVEYMFSQSDYAEVDNVINAIMGLKKYNGYRNGDFAILVRNNSLTRLYERSLSSLRLPYKVFGGFRFFDRKEILDVVAYMRLIVNPMDSEALTRIINVPKRGIGDTTIASLEQYAATVNKHLNTVIAAVADNDSISSAVKIKIQGFNALMAKLKVQSESLSIKDFAGKLVEEVGFESYYKSTGKEDDLTRWENIEEFLRYVEEVAEDNPNVTLNEFLQTLALNNEKEEETDGEYITIATMHSAKGLEFNVVFIVACEEGIIPSSMSLRENGGPEEERRVMYVAMTRARERLYISCVNGVRNKYGRQENAMASRFIAEAKGEEFKPANTDRRERFGDRFDYRDDYASAIPSNMEMKKPSFVSNTTVEQPKKVYNSDASGFVAGAKVKHKRYGTGTVIVTEGSGQGATVTVLFKDLGLKKFSVMNAPIELL